ncbi:acyl-CoA dehydrogenase family protein [Micromonospora olivasterospora]|uniref:Alkylation response protein AidB-like acyl-CoA dehydrogenase n=1 Tax=Micromonospora olivasterospora TaxID=1880 RepID=A0A562I3D4_MICOL|nr:acyl-CoA dehydrogenase family protein [Micromonospora olivasterospora]TWH65316.1 hypothetical protein JD77_00252 [Micromonospora olivasterospora]
MVESTLTQEQLAVRDLAAEIARDVLAETAAASQSSRRVDDGAWRALHESGLVAPVAEAFGGDGVPDTVSHLMAVEELAAGDPASAAAAVWSGHAAVLIGACGDDDQRARYLPRFLDPSTRSAVAHLEGFGRQPSELRATITAEHGGGWRVTGRKVAVAFAAEADPLVVVGTDPSTNALRAAVLEVPDKARCQIETSDHLGLDAVPLSKVTLDLGVPHNRIIGDTPAASRSLSAAITRCRLTNAALMIGAARRAREYAARYATERVAFGRTLSEFQGVAFLIADAETQLMAARLSMLDVASRLDAGVTELERRTTHTLSYAANVSTQVTRDAIQVMGGHGFITDHPVERWYRAVAGLASLDLDPLCSSFAPAL